LFYKSVLVLATTISAFQVEENDGIALDSKRRPD
jgi:hypothetical protein